MWPRHSTDFSTRNCYTKWTRVKVSNELSSFRRPDAIVLQKAVHMIYGALYLDTVQVCQPPLVIEWLQTHHQIGQLLIQGKRTELRDDHITPWKKEA